MGFMRILKLRFISTKKQNFKFLSRNFKKFWFFTDLRGREEVGQRLVIPNNPVGMIKDQEISGANVDQE